MAKVRVLLVSLAFALASAAPSAAQTIQNIGAWQYVKGGEAEAIFTESTDTDRTFSLEVQCEDGETSVALTFLLAVPGDDIGLDRDRFAPDGQVATQLDGNDLEETDWSFSTYSGKFVSETPGPLLAGLEGADRMTIEVQDTNGTSVGVYSFDLQGSSSALGALSCYGDVG